MAGTIKVRKFTLTGGQLSTLPLNKQVLLVQLAHVYNTAQVLQLFLIFTGKQHEDDAKQKAAITQNTLIARLLASVYYEGWVVLQKSFFGTKLSTEYEPQLDPSSRETLERVKNYFSKRNVAREVRNRFGFHFDRKDVLQELGRVSATESYDMFLSDTRGNSLFYVSEEIAGMSLLSAIGAFPGVTTELEAQNVLMRDLVNLSQDFQNIIEEIVARILLSIDPPLQPTLLDISDVPEISEVAVPFFIIPPPNPYTAAKP
jgi:hypothetical protein